MPDPRFIASPHGSCTDARRDTQRSGNGGLNGPGRLDPKYKASPSSERVGVMSKNALDRFLQTMSSEEIKTRLDQLKKDLASAQQAVTGGAAGDDRIVRSLQDSVAMAELRLDNYERAKKNAQFVSIELDRMESKIQALAEMAVNRQDPDLISSQVDSAAESMRQTEKAVSELQHLTGLADELQDPPPILDADLRQVLRHDS